MIQKLSFILLLLVSVNLFSQEQKGQREASIFYPTIIKAPNSYNISVDLFELGDARYIETELYDEEEVRLASKLLKLVYKNKKYFISEGDNPEHEVELYDINFKLENIKNDISYPKIKIKILDVNFDIMDYSQKIFY